jgi:hypothetical protein
MRRLAVLGLLAACGRVGFDARQQIAGDGSVADDSVADGAGSGSAALCDDNIIGDIGEAGTRVRATSVSSGWVAAVDTADYIAFGRVISTGTTGGIYKDLSLSQTYTLQGIGALGDQIGVTVSESGTAQSYLKQELATLDAHNTIFQWDLGIEVDPAYALQPSGRGLVPCSFTGFLGYKDVGSDGTEGDFTSPYSPQGLVTLHMATIASGYAVLIERPGGQCESFVMDQGGLTTNHHTFSCSNVGIARGPNATAYAVYDDAGATHLDDIPYSTGTTVSPAYTNHRVSVATQTWVASSPAAGVIEVHRIPQPGLVASVTGTAFDIVGDELFWVDGNLLHAGRLCLQPP